MNSPSTFYQKCEVATSMEIIKNYPINLHKCFIVCTQRLILDDELNIKTKYTPYRIISEKWADSKNIKSKLAMCIMNYLHVAFLKSCVTWCHIKTDWFKGCSDRQLFFFFCLKMISWNGISVYPFNNNFTANNSRVNNI